MNQKKLGYMIILLGVLFGLFVYGFNFQNETNIDIIKELNEGKCVLDDGRCPHDSAGNLFVFGWVFTIVTILIGLYLSFLDESVNTNIVKKTKIKKSVSRLNKSEKFDVFLEGFNDDERIILKAINNNEGITQSTLRYKSGLSKTGVSIILKSLETRNIISRKKEGKTNAVFLKKIF